MRRFTQIGEVPFTSARKLMSTVELDHEHADQKIIVTKGAHDLLLDLCSRARLGDLVVPLSEELRSRLVRGVDELTDDALRVFRSRTARCRRTSTTRRRAWSGT